MKWKRNLQYVVERALYHNTTIQYIASIHPGQPQSKLDSMETDIRCDLDASDTFSMESLAIF